MDRLDLAFLAFFRTNRRAAVAVRRYGVARFRQRVRQHLAARPLTFVQIEAEPPFIRGAMADVVALWDFDSQRQFRRWPITYREEVELFGHPGRLPLRRPLVVCQPPRDARMAAEVNP